MMNYRRTILHIDDEVAITRFVARYFRDSRYELTALNDATQAMDVLRKTRPRLVLLDIDMPSVNGLDLLREIKTEDGGIQVIMLTGLVSMQTVLQALRWGAEACLFKPLIDMQPLEEAVEHTFKKIDRWWGAIESLSREKHGRATTSVP